MQKKLMKLEEYDDASYWRVACDCNSEDHDVAVWIEHEKQFGPHGFSMEISANVTAHASWNDNWYQALLWRFKTALKVLFTGRIETSTCIALSGENLGAFEAILKEAHERYNKETKNGN